MASTPQSCHIHKHRKPAKNTPKDITRLLSKEQEQQAQKSIDLYSTLPSNGRCTVLDGILSRSCSAQISYLHKVLLEHSHFDIIAGLPLEVSFAILQYLDGKSLCHAAQVSKAWRKIADDDQLWMRMCSQHIAKTCVKCGWGLPLLQNSSINNNQRTIEPGVTSESGACLDMLPVVKPVPPPQQPWKQVYAKRLVVERNWRTINYSIRQLEGNPEPVNSMHFDEQMDLLVTAGETSLRAWRLSTGKCLNVMTGHTLPIRCVQFDNSKIISSSMDGTLRIWSLSNFKLVRVIEGQIGGVTCHYFDDKMLAAGSDRRVIRVWDFAAGQTFTLRGHSAPITKAFILPCKTQLLSCSFYEVMRLWDIQSETCIRTFSDNSCSILDMQPIPCLPSKNFTGPRVITGAYDTLLRIWDLGSNDCVKTLGGHNDLVAALAVDSRRVVSGSMDNCIKIWNLESGVCEQTLNVGDSVSHLSLSETKIVFVAGESGTIVVYDFSPKS